MSPPLIHYSLNEVHVLSTSVGLMERPGYAKELARFCWNMQARDEFGKQD